jgi:L,D-peptidoglycan transpeptidase YkuD (ErfK/YbiS/YcfS/YnhG family)
MMKWLTRSILFVWSGMIGLAAQEPAPGIKEMIPELGTSEQLIVVVSESWDACASELRRFERVEGKWQPFGEPMRANVGKSGMAWGIGVHGSFPLGGTMKREGDKRSPAGVFAFEEAFGAATAIDAGVVRFPYRQVTAASAGVDDPASKHYNRIVNEGSVEKDWTSAEVMLREDGTYRLGLVVKHNWKPYPGYGSCIFMHIWQGAEIGTSGCTALAPADLDAVVRWISAARSPLLVQLPRAEYEKLKPLWGLP